MRARRNLIVGRIAMRTNSAALVVLLGHLTPGVCQMAKVTITASQSDTDAQRDFVAGTIIIGRKRIEASSARSVEEMLQREPAVTVRDGKIGLLNLPGYTQILIDGRPPTTGKPLAQLALVHVEQIEIIKSSTAATGPFGIAGTINILSRKAARKTETTASMSGTVGSDRRLQASLSHNQSTQGSPFRWSVNASADQSVHRVNSDARLMRLRADGAEDVLRKDVTHGKSRDPAQVISGNLVWQTTSAGTFTLSPELVHLGGGSSDITHHMSDGVAWRTAGASDSRMGSLALPLKWKYQPAGKGRLDIELWNHTSRMRTDDQVHDSIGASIIHREQYEQRDARSHQLDLRYSRRLDGGHDVQLGAALTRTVEDARYRYQSDGITDMAYAALSPLSKRVSRQQRIHVQDEWRIDDALAATLGLSGEQETLQFDEESLRQRARYRVWSPSLHLARKFGNEGDRQLRLSLARSFKAPEDAKRTQRLAIDPLAACPVNGACAANTIDTADSAGNFHLQPERALGLNATYNHGLGEDSELTVEFFHRAITGKHGDAITLEAVPWAVAQRYVSRPVNGGDARTQGINVQLDLAMRDLLPAAPKASVRGSVGLASSRVSSLPGPDNRLDKQTPWSAKLGATYTLQGLPVTFDADANWLPGIWARVSLSERAYAPRLFALDASAAWSMSAGRRLVLAVMTRSPGTATEINEYTTRDQMLRLYTATRRKAELRVSFDTPL